LELNAKRNPQLDQVAYGRWAALYITFGEKEKAFEQFELGYAHAQVCDEHL